VFPPDELTSKLISRDREMVRLRNSSPFYLCEGVDIGDYKMRIRIRRAASPDVRPLPRSADASPFSVVDRAAALRPLAGIVRADHDRRLLAGRSGRLPGEGPTDCLYTSNTLMVWLRTLRIIRVAFVVIPIVFGALASWEILKGNNRFEYITATMALVAGLVPAIYAALKLDEHLPTATRLAGEYKNLEILFADLGSIGPHKPFDVFEAEYKEARGRLEAANSEA
jgi:hypothetical protein